MAAQKGGTVAMAVRARAWIAAAVPAALRRPGAPGRALAGGTPVAALLAAVLLPRPPAKA
jgi:hypothetical protein